MAAVASQQLISCAVSINGLVVARPNSSVGVANCCFMGSRMLGETWPSSGLHKVNCAIALGKSKANDSLLAQANERWKRVIDNPLEGLSFSPEEFTEAVSRFEFNYEIGDTVKGIVFLTESNGALIEVGSKAPAYLPLAEGSIHRLKHIDEAGLYPGVEEEFRIIRNDDDNGRVILSIRKLQYDIAWERCRQLQAEDAVVKGKVIADNRGGVVVMVEGLRGFVPFSQMSSRSSREELLQQEIPLKFLEVDEEQTRLVMSHRKALVDNQTSLVIGSVVEGIVQTVKPYGAFIDIGGVSGLLHISQISHDRIANVDNVLSQGDKLKVMVLSHDRDRGRISLSTKKLEPTPGDMLRNPALVYEKAEEMAQTFRRRISQVEAMARAEVLRMQQEETFELPAVTPIGGQGLIFDGLELTSMTSTEE
eukprot:c19221_g1_i1 orf=111-1373(+)